MDEEKSEKVSVSFPPELLTFVNERSTAHGSRSAYIQNLVRTDKAGALDPIHKNILLAIAKRMRPELAAELEPLLASVRQPEVLASFIDALVSFGRRAGKIPDGRLCLLSTSEVTDLAIRAYTSQDMDSLEMLSRTSPEVDKTIEYVMNYRSERETGTEPKAAVKPKPNPDIHSPKKNARRSGEKSA